ncbi:MAG: NUDIX domain-containing protein [Caldilineaceae bacterium]|nr:NUDIX domain-containing protein [Caldilineaceae bacterium]
MAEPNSHPHPISLAGAIIEHPDLGLLLQLRDDIAPTYALHWGLFGGHMESGETPDEALWRELEEELQLTPAMVSAWRLGSDFPHAGEGHVYIYYLTTHATLDDLVLGEGQAMYYADLTEIDPSQPYRGHPFTPLTATALRTYLAKRHNGQAGV